MFSAADLSTIVDPQTGIQPQECINDVSTSITTGQCVSLSKCNEWPSMYGCENGYDIKTLNINSEFDRYGHDYGWYAGEVKQNPYSYVSRSMNQYGINCETLYNDNVVLMPTQDKSKLLYTLFRTKCKLSVLYCTAAPWFDKPGGAIQYIFPAKSHIKALRISFNKYIREASNNNTKSKYTMMLDKLIDVENNYAANRWMPTNNSKRRAIINYDILFFRIKNLLDLEMITKIPHPQLPPFK